MITAQDRRRSIRRIVYISIALAVALVGLANSANAAGFEDKDFSLRFPAALSRFSSYADVAATGGASAGSKWQSSINPASVAWQSIPGTYHVSFNPQYSQIMFQEDTVLRVMSASLTKGFEKFGTFQVTGAWVRSNEKVMMVNGDKSLGIKFSFDMDYVQAQWGKRFSDDFAFGVNFNYSSSKVTNRIGEAKLIDSSSKTYGLRVGTLYRITEKLLGGLIVDYSQSPSTTTTFDIFGLGIGDVQVDDRTTQYLLRAGPSYEYRKDSTFNLDYQYGSFKNDTGRLEVHRMFAGIDHRIVDALFVRAGFALDDHGNTSWTGGLGIYPLKQLSIDIGYQYSMFPELQADFGRSHLVSISLGVTM